MLRHLLNLTSYPLNTSLERSKIPPLFASPLIIPLRFRSSSFDFACSPRGHLPIGEATFGLFAAELLQYYSDFAATYTQYTHTSHPLRARYTQYTPVKPLSVLL